MLKFIPIQYHARQYPKDITPKIKEVAGHFDIDKLDVFQEYSLHTEYSYGPRHLDNHALENLLTVRSANKKGIPQLWFNEMWALEFSQFIISISNTKSPNIIEIHPPFKDYCSSLEEFIRRYKIFEDLILNKYPSVEILLENRCGSLYGSSKFLVSSSKDLVNLIDYICKSSLKLKIALDIPQLISSFGGIDKTKISLIDIFQPLSDYISFIKGVHLWGKKRSKSGRWVSHAGNLNTMFEDPKNKHEFLTVLSRLFDDNMSRYFVPEVNSNDSDLCSIVEDLRNIGYVFV